MITHALLVPRLLTVVSGQDSALPVSALTLVLTVLPPHHTTGHKTQVNL